MKVLFVAPYVPSRIRTRPYNLIRALIRLGHQITLLTAAGTSPEEQEQAAELRDWRMRVEVFPVPVARSLINCSLALPTREPLQAVYAYHPGMERRLRELLQTEAFDVVHIEHLRASRLVRAVESTPPTVVFTGKMSYHANIAAVLYFAQDVLPYIWASNPNVQFQIVGKDPPETVRQLAADERIQVTGTVDNLRPYLARATVAVCPSLCAVGIQNKVLEAMAMGAPVVSTPAGCAALSAEDGREILIAGSERDLAAAVLRVLSDPTLAEGLSVAGQRHVKTTYSWETSARRLIAIYEKVQ
jgi:hypothetical protein